MLYYSLFLLGDIVPSNDEVRLNRARTSIVRRTDWERQATHEGRHPFPPFGRSNSICNRCKAIVCQKREKFQQNDTWQESATALPLFVSSVKVTISRPLARIRERFLSSRCVAGADGEERMKRDKRTELDRLAAIVAAMSCAVSITATASQTWFVDAASGSDANDGRNSSSAFASIQKAIDSAAWGDKVMGNYCKL